MIPVPLSQVRFNERGFNQSEWLARQMSKRTQLKIEIKGLKKTRETSPQSTLSRSERQKNLVGAFSWNPKRPAPERVCLIDDVLTTGSTLEACKSALQKAGVKEIFAWTLFEATTDILNRR
ncbi:MAG: ComF family protein [Pseudomonadota bacterium]